jgi:hypothetical protein
MWRRSVWWEGVNVSVKTAFPIFIPKIEAVGSAKMSVTFTGLYGVTPQK